MTCEEVAASEDKENQEAAAHNAAEAMTHAVVRKCPGCKMKIIKDGGCNRIKCSKCRMYSCYVCRKELDKARPYRHFCSTPHCKHTSCGKCILFTNTKEDDRLARREAGLKELKKAGAAGKEIAKLISPPHDKKTAKKMPRRAPMQARRVQYRPPTPPPRRRHHQHLRAAHPPLPQFGPENGNVIDEQQHEEPLVQAAEAEVEQEHFCIIL